MTTPRRVSPSRADERRLKRSALASGSTGRSERKPSCTLEASTPGVGADEPVARLGDDQVAASGDDSDASRARPTVVPRPRSGTTRPSAFDTTFWVTATTSPSLARDRRERRLEERGQVVARRISGSPSSGIDLDRHVAPLEGGAGQRAATSSSRMTVSVTATAVPGSSAMRAASARRASSITHASSRSR